MTQCWQVGARSLRSWCQGITVLVPTSHSTVGPILLSNIVTSLIGPYYYLTIRPIVCEGYCPMCGIVWYCVVLSRVWYCPLLFQYVFYWHTLTIPISWPIQFHSLSLCASIGLPLSMFHTLSLHSVCPRDCTVMDYVRRWTILRVAYNVQEQ